MVSVAMAARHPNGPEEPTDLSYREWAAAILGGFVALLALRLLPLHRTLALVRLIRRITPIPAQHTAAVRAARACRLLAYSYPGRAACLELSLATVLTSAVHRRHVDWCIGCRLDPCQSHAWVEADGVPVAEATGTDTLFHTTVRA